MIIIQSIFTYKLKFIDHDSIMKILIIELLINFAYLLTSYERNFNIFALRFALEKL